MTVQARELRQLKEILHFAVGFTALELPARQRVERHHVGPTLPGEAGQRLAAERIFAALRVGKGEFNGIRKTVNTAQHAAAAACQATQFAALQYITMGQRQYAVIDHRIESEDGV